MSPGTVKRFSAALCLIGWAIAPTPGVLAQGSAPSDKGKRFACAADVSTKKLRGNERLDAMQICMAEGRLDCVKRAVAQKVPPSDRKVFVQGCMQGPAAESNKTK